MGWPELPVITGIRMRLERLSGQARLLVPLPPVDGVRVSISACRAALGKMTTSKDADHSAEDQTSGSRSGRSVTRQGAFVSVHAVPPSPATLSWTS